MVDFSIHHHNRVIHNRRVVLHHYTMIKVLRVGRRLLPPINIDPRIKACGIPSLGCPNVCRSIHSTRPNCFNAVVENLVEDLKDDNDNQKDNNNNKDDDKSSRFKSFVSKCAETAGITFSSIAILGIAGLLYHKFYNLHVLDKIDKSFDVGDPASELIMHTRTHQAYAGHEASQFWVERPQQKLLDDIVNGDIIGRYFLIVGEKGTGKTSLLLESIKKVGGYNVTMFDAHADPEIFRIRLGKALNFAYSEDYIGSLFSIRGPRDTTALLDIERAFGKLEELAIKRVDRTKKPLIMVINNSHLIKENEEGIKLLELLQQKAESLSSSGLVTIIFNSDDYWVYEKLKKLGTRLELINVRDFTRKETVNALKYIRHRFFPQNEYKLNDEHCHQIYDLIGGRPQHISQVARHKDIIRACHEIIDREKTWFLNQCGLLGMEMDDDVMEYGKFSSSAMLLMREFVEMDRERQNNLITGNFTNETPHANYMDHHLPELPLWRSRQIMTRADYIQAYDNFNIFTLDSESRVRADSVPMMRAFHEIASQPHFDELLADTIQRVADIESLGRTREIVAKDLNLGSRYRIVNRDDHVEIGIKKSSKQIDIHGDFPDEGPQKAHKHEIKDEDDDDEELYLEDVKRKDVRKWWSRRMARFEHKPLLEPGNRDDLDINRGKS